MSMNYERAQRGRVYLEPSNDQRGRSETEEGGEDKVRVLLRTFCQQHRGDTEGGRERGEK